MLLPSSLDVEELGSGANARNGRCDPHRSRRGRQGLRSVPAKKCRTGRPDLPSASAGDQPPWSGLTGVHPLGLAFVLVASRWYAHRKLFQRLAFSEPGLTMINLAWLELVALVPFLISVLGAHPGDTAAVVPFLSLFVVLTLGYLALIARADGSTVDGG